jgi:hypothetical protein
LYPWWNGRKRKRRSVEKRSRKKDAISFDHHEETFDILGMKFFEENNDEKDATGLRRKRQVLDGATTTARAPATTTARAPATTTKTTTPTTTTTTTTTTTITTSTMAPHETIREVECVNWHSQQDNYWKWSLEIPDTCYSKPFNI